MDRHEWFCIFGRLVSEEEAVLVEFYLEEGLRVRGYGEFVRLEESELMIPNVPDQFA
jgi:hypothetical protein